MKYEIEYVTTDCDALEKTEVIEAHSFSEAVVLLERLMTYKQRIIRIDTIIRKG
jgi:hypothetical protein